jgi:hypothetical protein
MGVLVSNDKSAKELPVMRMALVICSRLFRLAAVLAGGRDRSGVSYLHGAQAVK